MEIKLSNIEIRTSNIEIKSLSDRQPGNRIARLPIFLKNFGKALAFFGSLGYYNVSTLAKRVLTRSKQSESGEGISSRSIQNRISNIEV